MARSFPQRLAASFFLACCLALSAAGASAQADEGARRRLEAVQSAIVGVEVQAIEDAPSSSTLGARREGTGVVIAPQGLVLTIGYLVVEAQSVQLVTREGRRIPAQVAVYDPVTGLGLLRPLLPLAGVTPAPLGQAAAVPKGSPLLVVAGGEARELGAVRLVDRRDFTGYWEYHLDAALFTSPPVTQHSGAGLFNAQGDLVGIGNLLMLDVLPEDEPGVMPGNLFIPVDVIEPVLAEMLRTGMHPQGRRPWMGVNAMAQEGVVRILRVTPGSPAQDAGLRPGHRVVSVDGQPVGTLEEFFGRIWSHQPPAESIRVTVREGGRERDLLVPVRERQQTLARPRGI